MRLIGIIVLALVTVSCGTASPKAGEEAVLIYHPWFFGHGGVDDTPIKTGLAWTAATTSTETVNMLPQQVGITFDDLMTSDGVPLDFHSAVQFRVTDSVRLVKEFGNDYYADHGSPGFFARNIEQPFRSAVRDSVKKRGLNEMAINFAAADEVDKEVTIALLQIVKQTNVPITILGVTLGRANPPDSIKHQRIETATQEQRIITEKQRKLAEDQRKSAEESRAAADASYNYKMNLTPDQYLRLETIKMQQQACQNGHCTFLFGNATPLVTVGK